MKFSEHGDESSGSLKVEAERLSAFQVRPCINHFILFIHIITSLGVSVTVDGVWIEYLVY